MTATAPAVIAEVISPSSEKEDLGVKAAEYVQLPSLTAYLVLAQDEPKIWVWLRNSGRFPSRPKVIKGLDAVISIASLGLLLPAVEIYADFR